MSGRIVKVQLEKRKKTMNCNFIVENWYENLGEKNFKTWDFKKEKLKERLQKKKKKVTYSWDMKKNQKVGEFIIYKKQK